MKSVHTNGRQVDIVSNNRCAFKLAIRDSDVALASRLEPWIADGGDYTTDIVEWLYRYHAYPLLFSRLARYDDAAHSPVEAGLWKTAASHNQPEALAMIWDYGHALNYLTPAQVKACDSAVAAGDEAGIADLCIKTSFSRAEAVYGAIKAKDTPRVKSLLAETSSLTEDYKPQLESYIAKFGLSEMLELLPPRPQKAEYFTGHLSLSAAVNGQRSLNNRRMYDGPLKKELDACVLPYISYPADASWPFSPVGSAVLNNDPVMARGLAKRGYKWLSREVQSLPPISMGLEDAVPGSSLRMYDGIEDSERYPSRPADESLWQRLNLFLPVIAEAEGPEGLRDIFEASARYGWNDVIDLTIAAGFDAKTTKGPVEIWRNWAGSGFFGLCKPSTGRKLLHLGLPLGPVGEDNWTVLRVAAAGCRDPQALRFLVTEAGVDVNELGGTMTALDEAMPRSRPEIVAVLKSLGAKSGKELVPEKIAETRQKVIAEGADPDFWEWD
ncbi:hypothetical protein [Asticcacaulis benevestitus]|uniref:Ankyrin n=1 Tax=Asticcacaulis benevestitus DSM 16100 = ATCC BAA-896 TaxID=1121022 RepID=V4P3Y2_9CAUL|nr:hypothetical protein [Asticcacaulis benevestitus]ESQ82811.1 hypothetical protein ABENE_20695 [Asticcacaulis benevestitus DSM 16100 = ATCC BAA-896]